MTRCSFYPCGVWEASKTRVASPHLPQPSGEWTADLKVCVRRNSEALKPSEDKRRRNSPVSKNGLGLILSVGATPEQDNKCGLQPLLAARVAVGSC